MLISTPQILYNDPSNMKLEGPVDFRHSYVDMSNVIVQVNQTTKVGNMWDMHWSKIYTSGFEPLKCSDLHVLYQKFCNALIISFN